MTVGTRLPATCRPDHPHPRRFAPSTSPARSGRGFEDRFTLKKGILPPNRGRRRFVQKTALLLRHFQRRLHTELARQRPLGEQPRHVPHLAAGTRLASCRRDAGSAPASPGSPAIAPDPPARPGSSSPHRSAAPPAAAAARRSTRICSSNWLAGHASMRPVAGVVRARRDLVHQHPAGGIDEHLDRQQSRPGPAPPPRGGRWPAPRRRFPRKSAPGRASRRGYARDGGSPRCRRPTSPRPRRARSPR